MFDYDSLCPMGERRYNFSLFLAGVALFAVVLRLRRREHLGHVPAANHLLFGLLRLGSAEDRE